MLAALALGGLTASPLGTLLVALVALAVVALIGRFVLSVAWKMLVVRKTTASSSAAHQNA